MKLVSIRGEGVEAAGGGLLPEAKARLTGDAAESLAKVIAEIERRGGCFRLADCYRDAESQQRAHEDWKAGRRQVYSPPAGDSMHEAGLALDLDLAALTHPPSVPQGHRPLGEHEVCALFEAHGWTFASPAVGDPTPEMKAAWHFEFRGPFQRVYEQAREKSPHRQAHRAMVGAAIRQLAAGAGRGR